MDKNFLNLEQLQLEAQELDKKAQELKDRGLVTSIQEGADIEVIKERQIKRVEKEFKPTEQKYFRPEQEFNTEEYIKSLRQRDLKIEKQAKDNLSEKRFASHEEYVLALEQEIHRLKYFPVLFISAPHIGENVSGVFPGEPTPLMYATSVIDRYVRTDTFPAATSPEVIAMMNAEQFDDKLVEQLIDRVKAEQPRVVGISNTSEGHFFAGEIAKIIKMYSPETMVILGGSHEDGVNAEAYLKLPIAEQAKSNIRAQETLRDERLKNLFDLVIAGDAPYGLAEIFKIIANNKDKSNQEIIEEIIRNKDIFKEVEGAGDISAVNSKNQVETIPLSGTPLDWNKFPLMFRGRLATENKFPIFGGKKTAQIMTQMSCRHSCSFCTESLNAYLYKTNKGVQPTAKKRSKKLKY